MKLKLTGQIFKKYTNIIIYKNLSSGSRVVPGGRADGRTERHAKRETGMTKLIVTFCNIAKST